MDDSTTKRCARCGEVKPLSAFNTHPRTRDGRQGYCRECYKARKRAEYQARCENDPSYREKMSEKTKRRYQENPEYRQKMIALQHKRLQDPALRPRILERARMRSKTEQAREYDRTRNADPKRRAEHSRREVERYNTNPTYHASRRISLMLNKHRRRAASKGERFTKDEWIQLCAKYDHRCLCCGERKPLTPDHIRPLSRGGSNTIENIQPLCLDCNRKKNAKTIDYRPLWGGS